MYLTKKKMFGGSEEVAGLNTQRKGEKTKERKRKEERGVKEKKRKRT